MRLACPVEGCKRTHPARHAMCGPCWAKVPWELQSAVYRTWRARLASGDDAAITAHRDAVDRAAAAVGP